MTCQVTGEVSDDNLKLAGGKLVLSKEGAEQIISEIQNQLQNQNKLFHTKTVLVTTQERFFMIECDKRHKSRVSARPDLPLFVLWPVWKKILHLCNAPHVLSQKAPSTRAFPLHPVQRFDFLRQRDRTHRGFDLHLPIPSPRRWFL